MTTMMGNKKRAMKGLIMTNRRMMMGRFRAAMMGKSNRNDFSVQSITLIHSSHVHLFIHLYTLC